MRNGHVYIQRMESTLTMHGLNLDEHGFTLVLHHIQIWKEKTLTSATKISIRFCNTNDYSF